VPETQRRFLVINEDDLNQLRSLARMLGKSLMNLLPRLSMVVMCHTNRRQCDIEVFRNVTARTLNHILKDLPTPTETPNETGPQVQRFDIVRHISLQAGARILQSATLPRGMCYRQTMTGNEMTVTLDPTMIDDDGTRETMCAILEGLMDAEREPAVAVGASPDTRWTLHFVRCNISVCNIIIDMVSSLNPLSRTIS
jgi:hypothetical protein